ncbi:NAD(P)/FAD-dependent oxidoreductase [Agrobacterium rosae]|uniref:D-amino-acid oxidase n=1 Tax=Agrobacterium rosae TaxID=1972867 RepID=A0AAE5S0Z7_9HYPH|nr:FAD-binding oxidoreductase [Agrobacterium rosae]KAA3513244.1 FAD-binding oxidoreductase [Agrobacterium rosae]KAA3521272.1 FAD-binding oxidoreductase [Agrobacterium rosae]MCM2432897.1 FAD-binding oxidoreductase [Agrobacterium rosae]MQB48145.1 FAD-binding oxidoreductase [Agrobacterium rosae]POO53569.1 D-amino-acid oxidase [Agrobacterium rosae]
MLQADSLPRQIGQSSLPSSTSLLIIGGGIMGLWAAVKAERLGIDTVLVDADTIGSGASGGLLGALMPHMPDRWSDKKQFQFDALLSLETEIAALEAETGLSAGYRRSGRIIPLPKSHLRPIAERHQQDALLNWDQGGRKFHWHVLDAPPVDGWVDIAAGDAGFAHDTFAARVSPRAFISLLEHFLRGAKHVRVFEKCGVATMDRDGVATLEDGQRIRFGHAVVSAGHHSFPLLTNALGLSSGAKLGQPVKGQAALLQANVDPSMPVVFLNGLYVVPHEDGTVAIGSTSEEDFEDALTTDEKLDVLIAQARQIVPSLASAVVVERWAGLRPKAIGRDPMVGPHPDHPRAVALTGGFKVSFGLAHRLADAALDAVLGKPMDVPASFTLDDHIRVFNAKM